MDNMFVHSSVSNCISIGLMIVHVLKYRTVSELLLLWKHSVGAYGSLVLCAFV